MTAQLDAAARLAEFNPVAPDQIDDPYALYELARREQPVFFSPLYRMWIVTRYDDVGVVLKDAARFTSAGSLKARPLPPEVEEILRGGYPPAPTLIDSDMPTHNRLRNTINRGFTPRRIAAMEPQIRALANDLIDQFAADGHADMIEQFAFPLPGSVICDLLGVPRADLRQMKRWSDERLDLLSAIAPTERLIECAHGFVAFQRYLAAQIADRREHPRDDLLTVLLPESLGGSAQLSLEEAIYLAATMLSAGHETTTHLIGNALVLLCRNPDQMQALRDDPGRIPNALEEVLRLEAPARGRVRVAVSDVELGGVAIPAGSLVMALWASGNRDDAQFAEPDHFDVAREDAGLHHSFGKGVHYCIGAPLARVEGRIALELLLARLPNLRMQPDIALDRWRNLFGRGYMHLPMEWG